MKIDAHHHLWHYTNETFDWIAPESIIARDFDADGLAHALSHAGVDAAIAVQARQTPRETRFLLDSADILPAIIGVVGWIDLRATAIDALLDADSDPRVVGYRHIVQDEADDTFLLGDAFIRGVRAVMGRGLSYDLLVNHAQLHTIPSFLKRAGSGRFILDHAAKPAIAQGGWQPWANAIAAVAQHPNLYCKLSGLVTEARHKCWVSADIERYLDYLFDIFGPDRLIWGSDWPVCLLAAPYNSTLSIIEAFVSRHCPQSHDAVFCNNALRAYAIGDPGV